MIYVLFHQYSDKSATHICGVTENRSLAETWYNANDENDVVAFGRTDAAATDLAGAPKSWRTEAWEAYKAKQPAQLEPRA